MKKTILVTVVFLAMMALACQNTDKKAESPVNEAEVKQRVEQMMHMDADDDAQKILTADLYTLQKKAQNVHFLADYCWGFQWDLGVMDACSETRTVNIEAVKPIDSLHCDVDMRFVDGDCYNEPYTLNLLKENGEWKIDNVTYKGGEDGTLRDDCKLFYADMEETYRTMPATEVMEVLLQEEPLEENYTDPKCLYYQNPGAIYELIDGIKNCWELFKQNPDYTEECERQIDEMLERIAAHI